MKKWNLLGLLVFLLCYQIQAQSSLGTDITYKNELGLEALFIPSLFMSASGESFSTSPYGICYKRVIGENAIRMGIGGVLKSTESGNSVLQNVLNRQEAYNLDIRLGFEHRKIISPRILVYGGMDVIGGVSNAQNSSSNPDGSFASKSEQEVSYLGGGPIVGLQFKMTKRLFISTEGSMYYSQIDRRIGSHLVGHDPSVREEKTHTLKMTLPTYIYINFYF